MIIIAGAVVLFGFLMLLVCLYFGTTPIMVSNEYPNTKKWLMGGTSLFVISSLVALLIIFCFPQYNVCE